MLHTLAKSGYKAELVDIFGRGGYYPTQVVDTFDKAGYLTEELDLTTPVFDRRRMDERKLHDPYGRLFPYYASSFDSRYLRYISLFVHNFMCLLAYLCSFNMD